MSRFKEHYGSMTIWELEQELEALKAELKTRYLPLRQCLENAEETREKIAQDMFSRPPAAPEPHKGGMMLPYSKAKAGDNALVELQRTLASFGCQSFGTMTDAEKGITIVQFKWRNQVVALHASWRGYAQAWLKENPHTAWSRVPRHEYEQRALAHAQKAVCSVLRDWVKGQITAVECGVMSFEAAFMPHMLLPSGERVIDKVKPLLPAPDEKVIEIGKS